MIQIDRFYTIGIDGGASNTRGCIVSQDGKTLVKMIVDEGSSLMLNPEESANCILNLIQSLCNEIKLSIENIDAIGLGLAGSSNKDGRDYLFGKLDKLKLSPRTIIMNDAEAAYEINCPGDFGILVTVGTGIICLSRNNGNIIREAGKGHDQGDLGSGYWMGKQALLNLTLNETSIIGDSDLEEIMEVFLTQVNEDNFENALDKVYKNTNYVKIIAKLSQDIISLAKKGNEISLSIVQEATHGVAQYILSMLDRLEFNRTNLVLAGNGSIIRNDFYRSSLNDELRFHCPDLKWTFSSLSPAYGAAIMAARLYDVDIKISDILKGDVLVSS